MVDVGVDEGDFSLVCGIGENGAQDLVHGGDTCAPGNHAELADEAWTVVELSLGTLDTNLVANVELCKVTGNVSLLVGFDDEIKIATVIVIANGGIATGNKLLVNFSGDGHVLANGEIEHVVSIAQLKAVTG